MSSHFHMAGHSQNSGNWLGDRSSVRQSKLYRQHESGNAMKAILGVSNLSWDTEYRQGVFAGKPAYDHLADEPYGPARPAMPSQPHPKINYEPVMAAAPRALTPPSPPAPAYHYSEPEPESRMQHVYSVNDYESMIGQHTMPHAETTSLSNSRRSSATSSRRSSLNTAARLSVQDTSRQSVKTNGNLNKSKPVVNARAVASEWIGDDFDSARDTHVAQPINTNKPKHVPARGRAIAAANAINNSPKHARHVGLKAKSNSSKAKVVEVDVSNSRDAKPVVQLGGLVNTNSGFSRAQMDAISADMQATTGWVPLARAVPPSPVHSPLSALVQASGFNQGFTQPSSNKEAPTLNMRQREAMRSTRPW